MKYLKIIYQFLIIFCLMNIWGACLAAEGGGRPISLGGAYIALSDDVHAASWNPAGLAWQQEKEFTYSGIINNRDDYVSADFVSDDYAAFAQPLKKAYHEEYGSLGGIGMYFHNSGFDDQEKNVNTSLWQAGISYGRNFSFAPEMSVGVGLNYYYFDAEVIGVSNTDAVISINLGYLWYINQDVTFGFLLENINIALDWAAKGQII
ncbi:MAG: hypothetical protein HY810_03010 [Candidatus Omnitrophica bacterium]|nr:hypothetical protein [Candidatus Omnitrophota bacterium]